MTTERPTIIPKRIKEAREGQAYTLDEFADLLEVSKQAIAQYENGKTQPSAEKLQQILEHTQQPLSYFTSSRGRDDLGDAPSFWRSLRRTDVKYRNRTVRYLEWTSDLHEYIDQYIEFPDVNLPEIEFNWEWKESVWNEAIENAASAVRDHWNVGHGPFLGIEKFLEANGIVISKVDVLTDDMDAVSRWQKGRPYILMDANCSSGVRQRFNLAHELAHILLHADVEINQDTLKVLEKQANYFAAALLLPRETFPMEVLSSSIDHFITMKSRWHVAISAMIFRSKDLEIITSNQYKYLWRQINSRKIRRVEPLDDTLPIPVPIVLQSAVKMLIENGVVNSSRLIEEIRLSPKIIEEISGYSGLEIGGITPLVSIANDNL